jgi:hypothetical protein
MTETIHYKNNSAAYAMKQETELRYANLFKWFKRLNKCKSLNKPLTSFEHFENLKP